MNVTGESHGATSKRCEENSGSRGGWETVLATAALGNKFHGA